MKPQTLAMLIFAVGCGLGAMVMTQKFLAAPEDKPQEETVAVLISTVELQAGTTIEPTMYKQVDYPKALAPENAITDKEKLLARTLRYHVGANEIITEAKLASVGARGLEGVVTPGMRAMTITATSSTAAAGFIKPNSRVDILLTTSAKGPTRPAMTKTIMQDVKVLAVNAEMQKEGIDTKGKVVEMVTFELTPEDVEKMAQAQASGQISMSLRNLEDIASTSTKGTTEDALVNGKVSKTERSKDPEPVLAEPTVVQSKEPQKGLFSLAGDLLASANQLADKAENQSKTPSPQFSQPAPVEPIAQVPTKNLKRLIYRDIHGNPLMEVLVDADSEFVESLEDLLEDVDPSDLQGGARLPQDGKRTGRGRSPAPPTLNPMLSITPPTSFNLNR